MRKILYLKGKNIVVYPEFYMGINTKKSINVIRGENRSGKSLSMSMIGNLLYFAPPLDKRKNTAKKLHSKNSLIQCGIKINDNIFHIRQFTKNTNSISYKIFLHKEYEKLNEEKHDLKIRTDIKNEIRNIFPQNEEQFYSFTYLNAFRHHSLLNGTGAQRLDFFDKLFKLDIYQKIRDKIKQEYNEIKSNIQTLNFINTELNELGEIQNIKNINIKIKKYKNKYKKYEKYLFNKQLLIQNISNIIILKEQIKNEEVSKNYIKTYKNKIKINIHNKDNLQIENFKYQLNEKNKKEKLILEKKLEKIKKKLDFFNLKEIDEETDKIVKNITILEEQKKDSLLYKDLKKQLINNKKEISHYMKTSFSEEEIKEKIAMNNKIIHNFSKLENKHSCPLCKSELNKELIKNMLNSALKDKKKNFKYQGYLKCKNEILDIKNQLKNIEYSSIKNIKEKLNNLNNRYAKLNESKKYIIEYLSLKDRYKKISIKNNLKDLSNNIKELENKIDRMKDNYRIYVSDYKIYSKLKEFNENNISKYIDMDINKLKKIYNYEEKKLSIYRDKLSKINSILNKYKLEYTSIKLNNKKINELNKKKKELDLITNNAHIYEYLLEAYSPKGLKNIQMQNIIKLFEDNLNTFSPYIFAEPFHFNIELTKTDFRIIAHRNNFSSDVHLLSGSESRCFQLLCLLSTIPFIDKDIRTNICILDEMESGLDNKSQYLYINEFLPMLNKIIPNIFIITPKIQNEFFIDGATEYIVKKNKGISKIEKIG